MRITSILQSRGIDYAKCPSARAVPTAVNPAFREIIAHSAASAAIIQDPNDTNNRAGRAGSRIGRFFRGYLMPRRRADHRRWLVLLLVRLFVEIEKWTDDMTMSWGD